MIDSSPEAASARPDAMPYARHVYHVYAIRAKHRQAWQEALQKQGIHTGIHYPIPVHLLPAFADLGYAAASFLIRSRQRTEVLSLPMFAELAAQHCARVSDAVRTLAVEADTIFSARMKGEIWLLVEPGHCSFFHVTEMVLKLSTAWMTSSNALDLLTMIRKNKNPIGTVIEYSAGWH